MMRALIFAPFILLPWVVSSAPTNTVEVGDPTIARDGDWYYVFSSGVGASIRRSKDLVNWELLPPVFPGAVPNWVTAAIIPIRREWGARGRLSDSPRPSLWILTNLGQRGRTRAW
ncbi:MAG: hypothetical protein EBT36_14155 [Betaproteobacteria bacterium]|nr:hypothetical protein [Betaproteobacteria bacterium]